MTKRQALHQLVDDLPEEDLTTAARVLEGLRMTSDPVKWSLDNAPLDDEPDDDDFDGGLTEARADAKAGRGIATEELRRELGLPPRSHIAFDGFQDPCLELSVEPRQVSASRGLPSDVPFHRRQIL